MPDLALRWDPETRTADLALNELGDDLASGGDLETAVPASAGVVASNVWGYGAETGGSVSSTGAFAWQIPITFPSWLAVATSGSSQLTSATSRRDRGS